jgi:hypothetical protein
MPGPNAAMSAGGCGSPPPLTGWWPSTAPCPPKPARP